MKTLVSFTITVILFLYSGSFNLKAQDLSGYEFKKKNEIKNTPVENQQEISTCWSFATTSFIESELIRMGKDALDLSEMYFVRYTYLDKADNYIRLHGSANFGQGGQAHYVLKGFSHTNGVAVVQEEKEKSEANAPSVAPVIEKVVTQELRQEKFDNYSTTDDHLMHLTGTAEDQNKRRFYLTKNSWGKESNTLGGKLYLSVPYVRLHTIAILVHKDAVPGDIKLKLDLNDHNHIRIPYGFGQLVRLRSEIL